jgi:hypothetical protein
MMTQTQLLLPNILSFPAKLKLSFIFCSHTMHDDVDASIISHRPFHDQFYPIFVNRYSLASTTYLAFISSDQGSIFYACLSLVFSLLIYMYIKSMSSKDLTDNQ